MLKFTCYILKCVSCKNIDNVKKGLNDNWNSEVLEGKLWRILWKPKPERRISQLRIRMSRKVLKIERMLQQPGTRELPKVIEKYIVHVCVYVVCVCMCVTYLINMETQRYLLSRELSGVKHAPKDSSWADRSRRDWCVLFQSIQLRIAENSLCRRPMALSHALCWGFLFYIFLAPWNCPTFLIFVVFIIVRVWEDESFLSWDLLSKNSSLKRSLPRLFEEKFFELFLRF